MKKLLATVLTLTMLLCAMGTTAFAATGDDYYNYDETIANTIKVDFVITSDDTAEGYMTADIVLTAYDADENEVSINELNTADLTFALNVEEVNGLKGDIAYEISAVDGIEVNNVDGDRYEFHYEAGNEDAAESITIGSVKLSGYGTFDFYVADADTNLVTATTLTNNIVTYYTPDGDLADTIETEGKLDLDDVDNDAATDNDDDTTDDLTDKTIAIATRNLDIVVAFPNVVNHQVAAYQAMKLNVTGGLAEVPEIKLGSDVTNGTVVYGSETSEYTAEAVTDLLVEFKDEAAIDDSEDTSEVVNGYKVSLELPMNTNYTIEVTGEGYRTARYNVVLTEDKTVQFWNNVMETATAMEIATKVADDDADNVVNTESVATVNYLAGDIVEDSEINVYDLSAVVSYFATENTVTAESDMVKYDLNRDGTIDSKDVAYVLVSWGN